jgi:glycosyltransferase involved in cell wall biosynthesis/SAM-dependent methyltransferase
LNIPVAKLLWDQHTAQPVKRASPFLIQYDFAKAAQVFSHGAASRTGLWAQMRQAFEMARAGQWRAAAAQFLGVAASDRSLAFQAHYHEGLCHLQADQIRLAAVAFERAALIKSDDFGLRLYQGIADHLLGLYGRANAHWWAALQMESNETITALLRQYFTIDRNPERFALYPFCQGRGIDVGCGSYKTHPDALGIDLIPFGKLGQVGSISDRPSQAGVVASGDGLPLADASLDYVMARHNLEHYNDPILALSEWQRVLKPGGVLGIILPDERFQDSIQLDPTHKHVFTPGSLKRILDLMNGFDIVYLDKLLYRWSFICVAQKRPAPQNRRLDYTAVIQAFEVAQVREQARRYRDNGFDEMAAQCDAYAVSCLGRAVKPRGSDTLSSFNAPEPMSHHEDKGDRAFSHPTSIPSTASLYMGLVQGQGYGWGVCSRNLIQEISKIRTVAVLHPDNDATENQSVPGTLFQALINVEFDPLLPRVRGRRNYGYTFFENELNRRSMENARGYDRVISGSTWCHERMLEKGITNGAVLIQGIDPAIFYPVQSTANPERFVIFSGGKFELRKGQDLVLRAVQIMQEKYPDVWLVNCWYNLWPASTRLMAYSRHIRFQHRDHERWADTMRRTYTDNGLDSQRITTYELIPQTDQRALYAGTDVGLFPNRCEGGTNLVLMEYMACAKPVIAANTSGHKDVVNERNALLLNRMAPFNVMDANGQLIGRWQEPSLDEIIAQLEHAYHHRDAVARIGHQAGQDLKQFTWAHSARRLLEIMGS